MSLEVALAENTAALKTLAELLARLGAGGTGVSIPVAQTTVISTPPAPTPTATKAARAKGAKVEAKEPLTGTEAVAALHGHAVPEPKAETAVAEAKAEVLAAAVVAAFPLAEVTTPAPGDVTYDDVKQRVVGIAKARGRDAVIATLALFGAKTGQELKPEQWAMFIDAADKVIAGEAA